MGRNSSQPQDVKRQLQKITPEADCMVYATLGPHRPNLKYTAKCKKKIAPEGDCMVYAPLGPHGPKFEQTQHEQKEASTR